MGSQDKVDDVAQALAPYAKIAEAIAADLGASLRGEGQMSVIENAVLFGTVAGMIIIEGRSEAAYCANDHGIICGCNPRGWAMAGGVIDARGSPGHAVGTVPAAREPSKTAGTFAKIAEAIASDVEAGVAGAGERMSLLENATLIPAIAGALTVAAESRVADCTLDHGIVCACNPRGWVMAEGRIGVQDNPVAEESA